MHRVLPVRDAKAPRRAFVVGRENMATVYVAIESFLNCKAAASLDTKVKVRVSQDVMIDQRRQLHFPPNLIHQLSRRLHSTSIHHVRQIRSIAASVRSAPQTTR